MRATAESNISDREAPSAPLVPVPPEVTTAPPSWLSLALSPAIVRQALVYAVVVGSILIAINHGEAIVRGEVDGGRWFQMALTTVVPYLVSTFSAVGALRRQSPCEDSHDAS
jgi:hypothetical protein